MKSFYFLLINLLFIFNGYSQQTDYKNIKNVDWVFKVDSAAFDHSFQLKKNIESYLTLVDSTRDLKKLKNKLAPGIYYSSKLNKLQKNAVQEGNIFYVTPFKMEFIVQGNHVLLIPFDSKGFIVKNLQVSTPNHQSIFDETKEAYIVNLKKKNQRVKISSGGIQAYYELKYYTYPKQKRIKTEKINSFWASNQPEYKPGDTLKFKYFNKKLSKKNQPIKFKFYSGNNFLKDTLILVTPYKNGYYDLELPLNTDFFELDNNIQIWSYSRKHHLRTSFKFSQYELTDLQVEYELNKEEYAKEDSVDLQVSVKDMNGLILSDAKLLVEIIYQVNLSDKIDTSMLSFDSKVYEKEWNNNVNGKFDIKIPVVELPDLAADYQMKLTAISSNYQQKEESLKFKVSHDLKFEYEKISNDKIVISAKNKNQIQNDFILKVFNENNQLVSNQKLQLDTPLRVNDDWKLMMISDSTDKFYFLKLQEVYTPTINFLQVKDSTKINIQSNQPFWYNIYNNKKILDYGYDRNLEKQYYHNEKDILLVEAYFFEDGKIKSVQQFSQINNNDVNIKINKINQSKPGDTINHQYQITDQLGKAISNADITAFGIKSSFKHKTTPFENASNVFNNLLTKGFLNVQSTEPLKLNQVLSSQIGELILGLTEQKNVILIDSIGDEVPNLLVLYNGKEKILSVNKLSLPIHASVDKYSALINAKNFNEKDSLLVFTNKSSFYIFPGAVKKGTRKVLILNESILYNDSTLVKKPHYKIKYKPSYYSINKPSYPNKNNSLLIVHDGHDLLNLDDISTYTIKSNNPILDVYKIKRYRLYPENNNVFEINENVVYSNKKLIYHNNLSSSKLKLLKIEDLDQLHFEKQLEQLNDKNWFQNKLILYNELGVSIPYAIIVFDKQVYVNNINNVTLSDNENQTIYLYQNYDNIYKIKLSNPKQNNFIRLGDQTEKIDHIEREKILNLLEISSGFKYLEITSNLKYEKSLSNQYKTLTVIDENGEPISNAIVQIAPNKILFTNQNGTVTFVPIQNKIRISVIGYIEKEIDIRLTNFVILENENNSLNEIVVIGYGTGRSNTLSGRIAGVSVQNKTNNILMIRGMNTVSSNYKSDINLHTTIPEEETIDNFISDHTPYIRNSFKDNSYWFSRLSTDENGEGYFSYKLPDDIGSWENYFIVTDGKKIYKYIKWKQKVYLPIFTEMESPKFLIKGDNFQLTNKIRNAEDSISIDIESSTFINDSLVKTQRSTLEHLVSEKIMFTAEGKDSVSFKYEVREKDKLIDGIAKSIPLYEKGIELANHEFIQISKDTSFTIYKQEHPLWITANNKYSIAVYRRTEYLIDYLYDCNEQLASKLIGYLVSKRLDVNTQSKIKTDRQINKIIDQLLRNQNQEGGWSWFDKGVSSSWITDHVYRSLIMAKETGFEIDENKIFKTTMLANRWTNGDGNNQMFGFNILNKLIDSTHTIVDTADPSIRMKIMKAKLENKIDPRIINNIKVVNDIAYIAAENPNDVLSNVVDLNVELYEYLEKINHPLKNGVYKYLLSVLYTKELYNTYTTSRLLKLLLPLINSSEISLDFILKVNGNEIIFEENGIFNQKINGDSVRIDYKGKNRLDLSVYYKYWDTTSISIEKDYNISSTWIHHMKAGDQQKLSVQFEVKKAADYIMVEIPIPAGLDYHSKPNSKWNEYHRTYFNHQVTVFYESLKPGIYTIEVPLIARYSGMYTINPTKISEQYFPAFYGRTAIKNITVNE